MKTMMILATLGVAVGLSACTDSSRARREATFSDRPADITCWSYGTQTFQGRSTGKISDREGSISFVDASNGRYTVIDGECRLVYDK